LAPQGFPLLGWHHLIDATAANRKALWNQARRHLHPFPFPFLGLEVERRLDVGLAGFQENALIAVALRRCVV
jgi:hypothetical protein